MKKYMTIAMAIWEGTISNLQAEHAWTTAHRKQLLHLACVLTVAIVLLLSTSLARAGVDRYVDASQGCDGYNCTNPDEPCRTIQHAVDVAETGDVIKLLQGKYYENIVITGMKKRLTIQGGFRPGYREQCHLPHRSSNASNCDSIILGSNDGHVFNIEALGTIIDLTIENVILAEGQGVNGAAIFVRADNSNDNYIDGGIVVLTLNDNWIDSNKSYAGGAVYAEAEEHDVGKADNSVALILTNNLIQENQAIFGQGGGAIYITSTGSSHARLILQRNVIKGNESFYDGGAILAEGYDSKVVVEMENNIIRGNSAGFYGAALSLFSFGGDGDIEFNSVNDTVTDKHSYGRASGIYLHAEGLIRGKLVNGIVWGNHGGPDIEIMDCDLAGDYNHDVFEVSYSDIGTVETRLSHTYTEGEGNVNVDPEFNSSLHLRPISPLLGAGICGILQPICVTRIRIAPYEDFEGDLRPNPGELECSRWGYNPWSNRFVCIGGVYYGCSMGADDEHFEPTIENTDEDFVPFPKFTPHYEDFRFK